MFTRVCVDVDDQGHSIGWSYERRSTESVETIHVGPWPGPFDTPQETFSEALEAVLDRYGVQMRLFD